VAELGAWLNGVAAWPPANIALEPTPNSLRYAPASGGADAARRQEAGAASCLAFLRRHSVRNRGRVTPHTDHRAVDRSPAPRDAHHSYVSCALETRPGHALRLITR
jgi:hypothetical protein